MVEPPVHDDRARPTVGASGVAACVGRHQGEVGMLKSCRVVELSGRDGWMAGFLLAQLGAEVVLVEPPGGHPRDAWFEAYNRGKRSVVASGADEVAELVAGADVVLAAGSASEVAVLDILAAADPALVTVAITPFGRRGPKADWLAPDPPLVGAGGTVA